MALQRGPTDVLEAASSPFSQYLQCNIAIFHSLKKTPKTSRRHSQECLAKALRLAQAVHHPLTDAYHLARHALHVRSLLHAATIVCTHDLRAQLLNLTGFLAVEQENRFPMNTWNNVDKELCVTACSNALSHHP